MAIFSILFSIVFTIVFFPVLIIAAPLLGLSLMVFISLTAGYYLLSYLSESINYDNSTSMRVLRPALTYIADLVPPSVGVAEVQHTTKNSLGAATAAALGIMVGRSGGGGGGWWASTATGAHGAAGTAGTAEAAGAQNSGDSTSDANKQSITSVVVGMINSQVNQFNKMASGVLERVPNVSSFLRRSNSEEKVTNPAGPADTTDAEGITIDNAQADAEEDTEADTEAGAEAGTEANANVDADADANNEAAEPIQEPTESDLTEENPNANGNAKDVGNEDQFEEKQATGLVTEVPT
ncbi:hypothetical protein PACTADRAFT_3224 [Pachysolen tannophilus NRRL Y-2460]|uniref:Uncharacterized protein n=1 Tax=Pachysolen tannophilus NRRL Y-2460 TaxID=669874 RepID=A0A1E4TUW7_PACTA|nr:hypothetical protein PACTADRAFT_3224 [Pachysolen tannophilus NRRL Y-2460]